MASLFSVLVQLSSSINDTVIGEKLRLTPMAPARGMKAAEIDLGRATIEPTGIYREVVARTKISDNAAGLDLNRNLMTPKIIISIRLAELGADEYRKGDIITRLDLPDQPRLEISAADPVDDGRITFTVVMVS